MNKMATRVTREVTISKPLLVENRGLGITFFRDDSSGVEIQWAPPGDPAGGDVQSVPLHFLDNPNFLRTLTRGLLGVYSAPDDVAAMLEEQLADPFFARQASNWRDQQTEKNEAAVASIHNTQKNDILTETCIGPALGGRGTCSNEVPIKEAQRGRKPPLCDQHRNLASQCEQIETDQVVNGKAVTKWQLVLIQR